MLRRKLTGWVKRARASRSLTVAVPYVLPAILILGSGLARGAVWPEHIGKTSLNSERPVEIAADRRLWDEYGLVSATEGDYGSFRATAYRFKDPTGSFAAKQWIAASNPGAVLAGTYVIVCQGRCPASKVWEDVKLPGRRHDEHPIVWAYLPAKGLIPGSGRYALGPVGLQQFASRIPESAAAFQFETEVVSGKYRTPKGEQELALLSFAAPSMARQQAAELQKLGGAVVKRTGSLVAVVPNPVDRASADDLLAQINYRSSLDLNESPPPNVTVQSVVSMVLTGLELAGFLILFCIAAGLGLAGVRMVRKRLGHQSADEPMILLHLVDR
jgi:hypothetical protein